MPRLEAFAVFNTGIRLEEGRGLYMEKTVVIHQPDFLPYIGFFHRMLSVDLWVVLDDAQFIHKGSKGWHNRDKIKTTYGEKLITVPIKRCPVGMPINEVLLSGHGNWREDHINLMRENYRKADHFNEVFPLIERLYSFECEKMVDFNMSSIRMLMELFNISVPQINASALGAPGKSNERLVEILKKIGATVYLSGVGAKDYFKPEPFQGAGIKVIWHDFKHPVYKQLHGDFIPYLSSIDMLLNIGIENSKKILRRC